MAIEWYLLKPPHDQLSGFEDEALNDFAKEGFEEVLESDIAQEVELCNYDLSECSTIKAVIQHNVDDTKLKTLSREIYVPIGTFKAGMYIKYKNRYWLIVGLVDDNMMYEKGIMVICNWLLTWLNKDGKVVQRWANITSASQYNNGETGTYYYTVRSDQLLILTPDDDESILLSSGQRFIIDKRCRVYEKGLSEKEIDCDTSNPVITYKMTRADSILYNYNDSGHFELMATQDEQHESDGYYVIDGIGYWLCDKPSENKTALLSSIECDSLEIYNGLEPCYFTAKFTDSEGNQVEAIPIWTITSDFKDMLNIEYAGNAIIISVDNKKLINKTFDLSLDADGYDTVTITITIRAFI